MELVDMPLGSLAVPHSDAESDSQVQGEREGVTPMSTVVKVEPGEADGTGMRGSLVDDLLREYEAAFPPTEDSDVVEVKEVICDHRLLSKPVVMVEKMALPVGVGEGHDAQHGRNKHVHLSDSEGRNAQHGCNKCVRPSNSEGHDAQRGRNKCVHPSDSEGRDAQHGRNKRVKMTSRVTRSCSKLKVKVPRSDVCADNIVQGSRHTGKNVTGGGSDVSHSVQCVSSQERSNKYKRRAVHVEKCTYCTFSCHSIVVFKNHLRDVHKLFVILPPVPAIGCPKGVAKRTRNCIVLRNSSVNSVIGTTAARLNSSVML